MEQNYPINELASTEEEVEEKYRLWKGEDPYPNIAPALLNSADILAYIKKTALLFPFYEKDLKGASYDVRLKGQVIYWDQDKVKQVVDLSKEGDSFELASNSIAFVTLEPVFRMPYYMALRFNLKIKHIYKGLLLGTGPLVDPGFQGKLSIPLHNLTSNTYKFCMGDALIAMEFTKMSPHSSWRVDNFVTSHNEEYKVNKIPPARNVSDYITSALRSDRLQRVVSSIPDAMHESAQNIEESKIQVLEARKATESVRNVANFQAGISVIAVAALVLTCIGVSINAINKANERYDNLTTELSQKSTEYEESIGDLQSQIDSLQAYIDSIKSTSGAIEEPPALIGENTGN